MQAALPEDDAGSVDLIFYMDEVGVGRHATTYGVRVTELGLRMQAEQEKHNTEQNGGIPANAPQQAQKVSCCWCLLTGTMCTPTMLLDSNQTGL